MTTALLVWALVCPAMKGAGADMFESRFECIATRNDMQTRVYWMAQGVNKEKFPKDAAAMQRMVDEVASCKCEQQEVE